jgi:predicted metal-binding protein
MGGSGAIVDCAAWLKVCVTCDRYAADGGAVGRTLADTLERGLQRTPLAALQLRRVECLSGCRRPGNVVLGGLGRSNLRFHDLAPRDTEAILALARAFATGAEDADLLRDCLRGRLAAHVPPFDRRPARGVRDLPTRQADRERRHRHRGENDVQHAAEECPRPR